MKGFPNTDNCRLIQEELSMKIYIVRHGGTSKNKGKRLHGRSNAPLNINGVCQAMEVKKFFEAQEIYFDKVFFQPFDPGAADDS